MNVVRPPIRYVGGKSWLVEKLVPEIEATKPHTYVEPFLGGGAIALALDRKIKKLLGDTNGPLVEMWEAIRTMSSAVERELRALEGAYDVEDTLSYAANINYLEARKAFNWSLSHPRKLWAQRAARLIYLNARCYNGLWRTNKRGLFNVPYGKLANPRKISLDELKEIALSLEHAKVQHLDFFDLMKTVRPFGTSSKGKLDGVAIFADPPYDGTYEGYSADGFNEDQQTNLAFGLEAWSLQGANVWTTNADTPLVRKIYAWANIEEVSEQHNVGATGERRGKRPCLLIRKVAKPDFYEASGFHDEDKPPTPISAKVIYVKGQGQTRAHHCHWPSCNAHVPPAMWGCRAHWFRLPKHLRDAIWRAYEPGQEATMTPSREYVEVARKVQDWIETYGGTS